MKVACHQPNFVPYLGYFAKMNDADIFALSDTVKYSRDAFFNYNFIMMDGKPLRITVPINAHISDSLKDIRICDWNRAKSKIIKSIQHAYAKTKYFKTFMPEIVEILSQDCTKAVDLNIAMILFVKNALEITTPVITESSLGLELVEKNQDIVNICNALDCDTYLSGQGAKEYIDVDMFNKNNIKLEFSSSNYDKVSVLDYLFKNGGGNPWKK